MGCIYLDTDYLAPMMDCLSVFFIMGNMWLNLHMSLQVILFTIVLLNPDLSLFENTVDPDQLASGEAI